MLTAYLHAHFGLLCLTAPGPDFLTRLCYDSMPDNFRHREKHKSYSLPKDTSCTHVKQEWDPVLRACWLVLSKSAAVTILRVSCP